MEKSAYVNLESSDRARELDEIMRDFPDSAISGPSNRKPTDTIISVHFGMDKSIGINPLGGSLYINIGLEPTKDMEVIYAGQVSIGFRYNGREYKMCFSPKSRFPTCNAG